MHTATQAPSIREACQPGRARPLLKRGWTLPPQEPKANLKRSRRRGAAGQKEQCSDPKVWLARLPAAAAAARTAWLEYTENQMRMAFAKGQEIIAALLGSDLFPLGLLTNKDLAAAALVSQRYRAAAMRQVPRRRLWHRFVESLKHSGSGFSVASAATSAVEDGAALPTVGTSWPEEAKLEDASLVVAREPLAGHLCEGRRAGGASLVARSAAALAAAASAAVVETKDTMANKTGAMAGKTRGRGGRAPAAAERRPRTRGSKATTAAAAAAATTKQQAEKATVVDTEGPISERKSLHGQEVAIEPLKPVTIVGSSQPHVPVELAPYLDVMLLRERGFRLARVTRDGVETLGNDGVLAIVDRCLEARVFLIVEGVFDEVQEDIEAWLGANKQHSAELSGRDTQFSVELGDYLGDLQSYVAHERGTRKCGYKWPLGTFSIREAVKQRTALDWLYAHPWLREILPFSKRGGLSRDKGVQETQFGPYTFGGDRGRSRWPAATGRRGVDKRDGWGGSTTHMDGNGSFCAAGGIKAGVKRVTCVETADAEWALELAGFSRYAKPGGSAFYLNDPITPTLRETWGSHGIAFGTFELHAGDMYFVPAGMPHEFYNVKPALSIAWNLLPHPSAAGLALAMAESAADEAKNNFTAQPTRAKHAVDNAPPERLLRRVREHPVQYGF